MRTLAIVALFALCAIAFAEDAPEVLLPCAFRLTLDMNVHNAEGETIATSMNEIMRDNGEYWIWKSSFKGDEFLQSIIEDHEWSITWRPDTGLAYRHDITNQRCYITTVDKQPTPYNWIQSKTYGIMWFDETVEFQGNESTMYSAIGVGSYHNIDFELAANFFVRNSDQQLLYVNGTFDAHKKEVKLFFESKSLSFDHNMQIPVKNFIIQAPCDQVSAPGEPSADFKAQCYRSSASALALSWLAVLVALLAVLMNF